MNLLEFHNDVYEHLISTEIRFKPRVMTSDRLNKGYWFIGDESYLNLSFWDGYDQLRKIHRLGFAIDFHGKKEVYLNLSAKDNEQEAKYLKILAEKINAKPIYPDLHRKFYGANVNTSKAFINLLDEFIETDKRKLDKYISNSPTISHITQKRFNRNIERINSIRSHLGMNITATTRFIEVRKKFIGRGGVRSKNIQEYIREQIAKKITVKSIHNQLQNELFKKLNNEYSNDKLIMEENWIDILQVSEGKNYLYEIKPYESPTKCIREGIGQLLHYCSQQFEDTENVILVIAGPNRLRNDDIDYLKFIQATINIETKYLQIIPKKAEI